MKCVCSAPISPVHIGGFGRPPVEDSAIHRTAMGIRVLQEYPIPALETPRRGDG